MCGPYMASCRFTCSRCRTALRTSRRSDVYKRQPTSKAARRLVYPAGAPQAEVLPGHKLVRVAFGGTQTTDKPLVASLAIECGALVSIMAADTRIVNGQTLGSMLLALPDDDKAAAALEYIRNYPGITFEEVNG